MSDLFLYLLKANIALMLFYLGYYLWLRKLTFYGINRYYLAFAFLFSAIYPSIPIDSWFASGQEIPASLLLTLPDWRQLQLPEETTVTSNGFSLAYWISVGLFGFLFLVKLLGIGRIHFRSVPAQWERFHYRKSIENISPFSFWTNIYFNPHLHAEDEYEKIFKHEQVHVRQLHSLDILVAEIALIFFWYNPFCWMIRKAIQENIEFITDQRVLSSGIDKKSYQYSLIQISTLSYPSHLGNHFNFKNLKKRIIMMNKKQSSKRQLGKYLFIFPAAILGSLIFGISNAHDNIQIIEVPEISLSVSKDTLQLGKDQGGPYRVIDADLHIIDREKQSSETSNRTLPAEIKSVKIVKDNEATRAHKKDEDNDAILRSDSQDTIKSKDPLYIIDGVKQTPENKRNYHEDDIEAVNVLKGNPAIAAYGEEGKNGVIEVTTKKGTEGPVVETSSQTINKTSVKISTNSAQSIGSNENHNKDKEPAVMHIQNNKITSLETGYENVLIFVDGKKLAKSALYQLNPENIKEMSVFKGENAIQRYGEEGKDGVIEITTKTKN